MEAEKVCAGPITLIGPSWPRQPGVEGKSQGRPLSGVWSYYLVWRTVQPCGGECLCDVKSKSLCHCLHDLQHTLSPLPASCLPSSTLKRKDLVAKKYLYASDIDKMNLCWGWRVAKGK